MLIKTRSKTTKNDKFGEEAGSFGSFGMLAVVDVQALLVRHCLVDDKPLLDWCAGINPDETFNSHHSTV
jgi:hypothetical protein